MFCEGTRFTKSKHETGIKIAKEKGLPILKHHLLPRTKGFSLLARGANGRSMP
jgi:lysophosphatidic acid acyltransferase/lysophosphatidylinositol acyltransferase